jgi:hypothetical protein
MKYKHNREATVFDFSKSTFAEIRNGKDFVENIFTHLKRTLSPKMVKKLQIIKCKLKSIQKCI